MDGISLNLLWEIFRYHPNALFIFEIINSKLAFRLRHNCFYLRWFLQEIFLVKPARSLSYDDLKSHLRTILQPKNRFHARLLKSSNNLVRFDSQTLELKYFKLDLPYSNHFSAQSYTFLGENDLFICGGKINAFQAVKYSHIYNLETQDFQRKADMGQSRAFHSSQEVCDLVYVFGGSDGKNALKKCAVYNI